MFGESPIREGLKSGIGFRGTAETPWQWRVCKIQVVLEDLVHGQEGYPE